MNKRFVNLTVVLLGFSGTLAYADGPTEDYDHSEPAVARTLSPNEYLINADGAQEDPAHKMSETARAYRNGMIAGRKEAEAKQQAAAAKLPPLPAGMGVAEVTPLPAAQTQYRSLDQAPVPAVAARQQYAQYQQPQPVQQVPVQYVQQQNVYAPPPAYAEQPDDGMVEAYEAPPPVYAEPVRRYVYVQPPPRVMMAPQAWVEPPPPRGYWPRRYGDYGGRPYAAQSYYQPYYQPY